MGGGNPCGVRCGENMFELVAFWASAEPLKYHRDHTRRMFAPWKHRGMAHHENRRVFKASEGSDEVCQFEVRTLKTHLQDLRPHCCEQSSIRCFVQYWLPEFE